MTEENKQRVRYQIKKDNEKAEYGYEWHIVDGMLGEPIRLANGQECELIYVDTGGYPQICVARYDDSIEMFIGVSERLKGNRMSTVIAYRIKK